jgi:predicted O-methyltransferase YrrM
LSYEPTADRRFYSNNPAFSCVDAWALAALIMHKRPNRMIEIGSGYSSALMLDTCEQAGLAPELTFVDPYPALLKSLLRPEDHHVHRIHSSPIQDVDPSIVDPLEANDILFIDSTHVAKAGSDVVFELFELLPRLKPGVLIHIHDIHYPFEYPEAWFFNENRSWNEAYILRALLTENKRYAIALWNHYLVLHHAGALRTAIPDDTFNWGASIWLTVR